MPGCSAVFGRLRGAVVFGVFLVVFDLVFVVRAVGDFATVLRGDLAAVVRAGFAVVVFLAVVFGLVYLLLGDGLAFAVTVRLEVFDVRAFAVVVVFFVEPAVVLFLPELIFADELFAVVFFLAGRLAAVLFLAVVFLVLEVLDLALPVFFFAADDFERELELLFFAPLLFDFFAPDEREPVDFFFVGINYFPPDDL